MVNKLHRIKDDIVTQLPREMDISSSVSWVEAD